MIGLDLLGAVDSEGLIDTAAAATKGLINALTKKDNPPGAPPPPAAAAAPTPPAEPKKEKSSESFFEKPIVGPVKVWHGVVLAVVGTGGYVLLRRRPAA